MQNIFVLFIDVIYCILKIPLCLTFLSLQCLLTSLNDSLLTDPEFTSFFAIIDEN